MEKIHCMVIRPDYQRIEYYTPISFNFGSLVGSMGLSRYSVAAWWDKIILVIILCKAFPIIMLAFWIIRIVSLRIILYKLM